MLCLSLNEQSPADVEHALKICDRQGVRSSSKQYNLYYTCRGVHRGTGSPREKLQVSDAEAVHVELPWNGANRGFLQWESPEWSEHHNTELLAPLAVVPVHEKTFKVSPGVHLSIVTQGNDDQAITNVVLSCIDVHYLEDAQI